MIPGIIRPRIFYGWWQLGGILASICLGLLLGWWATEETDRSLYDRLLSQAIAISSQMDIEEIRSLSFDEKDRQNTHYRRLSAQMAAYAQAVKSLFDPQSKYLGIYSMVLRNQKILFGPESIGEKDPLSSSPGTVYRKPPIELVQVFQEGRPQTAGPYTDEYGTFVSVFAPVTDPVSGKVSLVVGIDLESSDWRWMIIRSWTVPVLCTIILVAILLTGSAMLSWRSNQPPNRRWRWRYLESFLAAAIGSAVTMSLVWLAYSLEERSHRESFVQLANSEVARVDDEFRNLIQNKLESLARLFESKPSVSRLEFRKFTQPMVGDPTVRAWGWVAAVPVTEKVPFETEIRREGETQFALWQKDIHGNPVPVEGREIFYPLVYIEPLSGNERAVGYDLGSEPIRRAALEEAMRTGFITVTDPITLVHDKAGQGSLLVIRAIFHDGHSGPLRGFAVAILSIAGLLEKSIQSISSAKQPSVVLNFHQLQVETSPILLASTSKSSREGKGGPSQQIELERAQVMAPLFAFGKAYAVTAYSAIALPLLYPMHASWSTAMAGALITIAMMLVVGFFVHRREGLERQILDRTAALRESELRLQCITSSAQDAILMMDHHGQISFWNPAAQTIFGYTPEEALGRNLHELLVPERLLDAHRKAFPEFLRSGTGKAIGKTLELAARRKDGQEITVALSLSAVSLQDEWQAVGILRDITAQRATQEALLESNRRLQKTTEMAHEMASQAEMANQAKSEFLANMSHEIRTPMNGVIGITGLLLDTDLTEEQRRYVEILRASGESLLSLINDILDFSKIEAKKLELEILDFDLRDLLDEFAGMMAGRAQEKGLELFCAMDPDVPPYLQGDPGRVRQILSNLTGNAVKFTAQGEILVRVGLLSENEAGARLRFTVRDTGIGIPQDKIAILFSKFSQVDSSTTRKFGGTGLGLAISKQLVELMGGEIGVNSTEGQGSEFWFSLVLAKQPSAKWSVPSVSPDLYGVRVLVVDDSAANREILTVLMNSWGLRAAEAADAPTALRTLHQAVKAHDPFQIAILDMQMPDISGEELGREIKSAVHLQNTRLIMMTSQGLQGERQRLCQNGFACCLVKPVPREELRKALIAALSDEKSTGPTPPAKTAMEGQNPEWGHLRILLAEDNITNQQVALGILKKLGLYADAVSNGEEAVRALEREPYDLVIMDVQMPVMDGLEATRTIRHPESAVINHETPIIAMTAHALQGDREKCLQAGMNDYITKPVQAQALAATLKRWLPFQEEEKGSTATEVKVAIEQPMEESGLPIFDRAGLMKRVMGDSEFAQAVIACFIEDTTRHMQKLKDSLQAGDALQIERQAHSIKGAAANVGGEAMRQSASEIEQAGREGRLEAISARILDLEQQFEKLKIAMAPAISTPK